MTEIFKIIVVFIIIYFAFSFIFQKDVWIGFYYPDETDLTQNTQSPELKSLDECRNWVNSQVYLFNPSGYGYDYECGKNCKFDKNYQLYICEETLN